MLGVSAPLPPGRSGFHLGPSRRAGARVGRESLLRYSAGSNSLPTARGACGAAVRAISASNCGGPLFRSQFGTARPRTHPARSGTAVSFFRLSLLGRAHDGAVVAAGHVFGVLPVGVGILRGQAPDRCAGRTHSLFPHRMVGGSLSAVCKSCAQTPLAAGMDSSTPRLSALRALVGRAGTAAGPGALAMARPRCPAAFPGLRSAAALVLRFVHLVADSENAPEHRGHRGLQLGSRTLALVSHAAHDAASRSLVRPGLLCSDADCGLDSSAK